MHNYSIIKSILSEPWAISEMSVNSLAPLVINLFDSRLALEKGEMMLPEIRAVDGRRANNTSGRSYNVSVISISGAMTKDDQECGPAGMATMTKWMREAKEDASIDAIILKKDTPGGSVVGTQEFADEIASAKQIKPVLSFVDDTCCSGGYWLASQCDEIIANNNFAQVGSIGVMMSFADVQPYYESLGVKFHTINASQSENKNKIYQDVKEGKYEQYRKEVLDPLAENFIGIVKKARSGVSDDQLTGNVYYAKNVVGSLVDSIGNFDYALERAAALCEERQTSHQGVNATEEIEKPNSNLDMKKITILGTEYEINAEGTLVLAEAQANAIVTALAASGTSQETITAHEATISAHEATIVKLQTKITALENEPGAKPAVAVPAVDGADAETISPRQAVTEFFESLK